MSFVRSILGATLKLQIRLSSVSNFNPTAHNYFYLESCLKRITMILYYKYNPVYWVLLPRYNGAIIMS